ncbi:MAG TPA: META domain-containing protein [Povalibacter sp.]|nr:META domain-containing protein [Povalibacter sp.]
MTARYAMTRPIYLSRPLVAVLSVALLCGVGACSRKQSSEPESAVAPPSVAEPPTSAPAPTGKILDMMGPQWTLESFDANDPVPADVQITLAVSVGKLNGNGGCNRYMGSIDNGAAPGQLVIGPLASTDMACAQAANEAERRYLSALQYARTFTVQDGKLLVGYMDGDTARTLTYSR